jgi:hypothetical protein
MTSFLTTEVAAYPNSLTIELHVKNDTTADRIVKIVRTARTPLTGQAVILPPSVLG